MTFFSLHQDASVNRHKAINNNGIPPEHGQFIALVSFQGSHSSSRNIDDHVIAHFAPYFVFFFSVQSILYREGPENWQFMFYGQTIEKSIKIPLPPGSLTIINNRWLYSIASLNAL